MNSERRKEIEQDLRNLKGIGLKGAVNAKGYYQDVSDLLTELDAKDAEIAKGEADYLALSEMHNNLVRHRERRISELMDQIAELKRELQRIGKGGSNG
jgi:vacuolar-type H+-ATPase subunit I/STV1